MNHLNQSQTDAKPQKQSSTKNSNFSASGSSSNANSNGVYVDLGKALLEAAKCGDTEKVQECIKNGAPFITDWLGTSALHVSAKNNYYETCATLLRSGISKDSKTKVDRTPLHFAVFEGNFEICQLLIQYECSIDSLDMLKMTPLHWAIEKGFDNIAELLIENGANPHIMSKFLKTPYLIAKEKNNDLIVNLIEMLPTTPCTPLSQYESSVFTSSKTPTSTTTVKVKDEMTMMSEHRPATTSTYKRERFHSYDSADTAKRLKLKNSAFAATTAAMHNDAKNLTLQLLKEQMSMMTSAAEDNLIQSALQSGRKIMLSEAGRRLLNDSNLNKFLKIPLNTTISSTPSPSSSSSSSSTNQKSVSPRSTTTTKSMTIPRRTSDSSATDILEIFRETGSQQHKSASADILNMIKSTSELQEVTITQRSSSSKVSPLSSPKQKTSGISLSAINLNVPKAKAQQQLMKMKNSSQLPSTDVINNSSPDFRSKFHNNIISTNNNNNNHITRDDGGGNDEVKAAETVERKYLELFNNFQQLKKSFEREKQKNEKMQSQLTQLQSNFETYKQQQNSIIQVLLQQQQQQQQSGNGNERRLIKSKNNNNYETDDDDSKNVL